MTSIVTFFIGVFLSWLITHIYYKRNTKNSERDNKNIIENLQKLERGICPSVREIIIESGRENLSVSDLNDLLYKKCVDENTGDPLPYKCCPNCGNKNLKRSSVTSEDNESYDISCEKCGWGNSAD